MRETVTWPQALWHPWLRVQRVLWAILTERWSADTWEQLKPEIPNVFAERSRVRRAGWFN